MSAASVVISAGSGATATIQEKCNLENISWIDLDKSTVQPTTLKSKHLLFISNKQLLAFLKKRKNHQWVKLLEDIAEDSTSQNDLSKSPAGPHMSQPAVIFLQLSPEDLDAAQEMFEGIEQLKEANDHELATLVMEKLTVMSGSRVGTAPSSALRSIDVCSSEGAIAPIASQCANTEPVSSHFATVPISSQCATAPISSHCATAPISSHCATAPISSRCATAHNSNEGELAYAGVPLYSSNASQNRMASGPMSSYLLATCTPRSLDATRSLSSMGLDFGFPQTNPGSVNSPLFSNFPNPGNGNVLSYIPLTVAGLSIGGGEVSTAAQQGQLDNSDTIHLSGLGGAWGNHPQQKFGIATNNQNSGPISGNLNIAADKSLEDNVSSGSSVSDLFPSQDSLLSGQGAASHIDPKQSRGDKAAEDSGDDVLVVDLPFKVMQYLSSEMDIDPNYGKGWIELASLKGYVFSRVTRILGNRSIDSKFQFLLSQQEFSGYTYGQLKTDLKIIPRLDILQKLEAGSFQ